jgi:hypothetical protein
MSHYLNFQNSTEAQDISQKGRELNSGQLLVLLIDRFETFSASLLFSHFEAFSRILSHLNAFRFSSRFPWIRQSAVIIMRVSATFVSQHWRIQFHPIADTSRICELLLGSARALSLAK